MLFRSSFLFLLCAAFLFYGYGVAVAVNCRLDRGRVLSYSTNVTGKRERRGKSTSYFLRVGPWGPLPEGNEFQVGYLTYVRAREGDKLEMLLHRGALGARWFTFRGGASGASAR